MADIEAIKHCFDATIHYFIKDVLECYSMNIYHNDLKPANIMFDPQKQLFYLIDFGISIPLSLMHQTEFMDIDFFTTLPFMSPSIPPNVDTS